MPTLSDVNVLHRSGLLPPARYFTAAAAVRDGRAWTRWAARAILAIGVGHLLAGIVSFFAFNWADMPTVAKFATVEAGIVLALAGAWLVGIHRLIGQALLIGASVLVGVLLAVIGQEYHTDADAYSLFVAWTLLILPWTLASRSAAQWCVWLIVLYLAIRLYGDQALIPDGRLTHTTLEVALGMLTAAFLASREVAVCKGMAWLASGWTRIVLLIAALALMFWPAMNYVVDGHGDAVPAIAFVAALVLSAIAYRRWLQDFAASTAVIGFGALLAVAIGYRAIDETVGFDWEDEIQLVASVGLLVLWSAATMGLAAKLLQLLRPVTEPLPS